MKNRFLPWFCGVVFLQFSESLDSEQVYFRQWLQNTIQGTSFYTFEWMVKVSVKECVNTCKSTKACEYINYEVRSHKCALVRSHTNSDDISNADVKIKPGYMFGNKSNWTSFPKEYDQCEKCNSYGPCYHNLSLENNNSLCRNSGCRKPSGEDFLGNMASSGSRIIKFCDVSDNNIPRSTSQQICLENGTWRLDVNNCPQQKFYDGTFYTVQSVPMSWHEAKKSCEKLSGHLIDINTEEEHEFFMTLIKEEMTKTWIGGNDMENEGDFKWSDGSSVLAGYEAWASDNPKAVDMKSHCMYDIKLTLRHKWHNGRCYGPFQSVCELQ